MRRPMVIAMCGVIAVAGADSAVAGTRPRTAVAIVIDQFAAWVADARLEKLPRDGGFARLRSRGTWVKRCEYAHAATDTAPGHAALFTGKTPRETGIVANRVWRADLGRSATLVEDKDTRLVSFDPIQDRMPGVFGVSLRKLKTRTIADELMSRPGGANVISLSLKDRGAVFGAGRRDPTQTETVLWYDDTTGRLVTSTAFADSLPAWAKPFESLPRSWLWELSPRESAFLGERTTAGEASADAQDGEAADLGGTSFPHPVTNSKAYRGTPDADRLLVDLALEALAHRCDAAGVGAGCHDRPTLLVLSLSANDYIGHRFGPDSWEAWDELVRLDAELKRLLQGLDAQLGRDRYSVLITGDHGVTHLPEVTGRMKPLCTPDDPYQLPCEPGTRLSAAGLRQKVDEALKPSYGVGTVRGVLDPLLFLGDDARALVRQNPDVDAMIRSTLLAQPGVAAVYRISDFKGGCGSQTGTDPKEVENRLVCEAVFADDSGEYGDYYIVPKRGSFFADLPDRVGHGTPYAYDRAVPLLVAYPHGKGGITKSTAKFTSFHDSLWYALTGEIRGDVVAPGVPAGR